MMQHTPIASAPLVYLVTRKCKQVNTNTVEVGYGRAGGWQMHVLWAAVLGGRVFGSVLVMQGARARTFGYELCGARIHLCFYADFHTNRETRVARTHTHMRVVVGGLGWGSGVASFGSWCNTVLSSQKSRYGVGTVYLHAVFMCSKTTSRNDRFSIDEERTECVSVCMCVNVQMCVCAYVQNE